MNTADNTQQKDSPFKPTAGFILYSGVKRCFDFSFAVLLLILAALPCAFIAAAIKLTSKGNVIFKQKRVGRYGKIFYCYKFRTMYSNAPKYCATANLNHADSYITPVGKILRKTSLDEIPQIINVLKGDMSFIGPRPLIPDEQYIHTQRKNKGVYRLRPGISGLAQINGRDLVSPDKKVEFDYKYLQSIGFKTDFVIFFKTIIGVLCKNDVVDNID